MHPRKFLWFAKFHIMGEVTVEKQFGSDLFARDAIKAAFRDGLTHQGSKDSFIVYPPSRITSVTVERRESTEEECSFHHRGPRWNI